MPSKEHSVPWFVLKVVNAINKSDAVLTSTIESVRFIHYLQSDDACAKGFHSYHGPIESLHNQKSMQTLLKIGLCIIIKYFDA